MTIYWTVRTFPWGTKWLQVNIIIKISVKLIIFACTWICLGDYLLLFYYNNVVIWNIMKICNEQNFFERIVCDYRSLPVLFTQFVWEVNPFNHGVQVMLLCCNFKIWGLKTYFWCFDIYQFFYILPLLLKGLYQDSLNNHELFWDKNWKWTFRGKHRHKRTCVYHCNCKMLFLIPVNNSKSKFCTRLFKNKIFEILVEIISCLSFLVHWNKRGNKKSGHVDLDPFQCRVKVVEKIFNILVIFLSLISFDDNYNLFLFVKWIKSIVICEKIIIISRLPEIW